MKKIVLIFLALLFLVSIYIGFRAAARMNEHLQNSDTASGITAVPIQQNYLIFHVSELNGESPFLIAVWGLFVNYSSPPHLAFVSLYPATDAENDDLSFFRLNRDGTLPDRVVKKIERTYDIETNGYILLDNFTVASIEAWVGQGVTKFPEQQPLSPQEFESIVTLGQSTITGICSQISQNGFDAFFDSIHWKELLPDHFSTSLTTENWLRAVDTLTNSSNIDNCEVFTSR